MLINSSRILFQGQYLSEQCSDIPVPSAWSLLQLTAHSLETFVTEHLSIHCDRAALVQNRGGTKNLLLSSENIQDFPNILSLLLGSPKVLQSQKKHPKPSLVRCISASELQAYVLNEILQFLLFLCYLEILLLISPRLFRYFHMCLRFFLSLHPSIHFSCFRLCQVYIDANVTRCLVVLCQTGHECQISKATLRNAITTQWTKDNYICATQPSWGHFWNRVEQANGIAFWCWFCRCSTFLIF